jgi:hypothetical protein
METDYYDYITAVEDGAVELDEDAVARMQAVLAENR